MKIEIAKRMTIAAAATLALATFAGCTGLGGPATPEQQVKARAQERQNAVVKRDLAHVYQFFTPAYRAAVTEQSYKNSIGHALTFVASTVESVTCESLEKCVARVKIETKPLAARHFAGTIITYGDETWLLEGGQWWLFETL